MSFLAAGLLRQMLVLALLGWGSVRSEGCSWAGKMSDPGRSGPCPSPMQRETCPVTPTYDEISHLWPCPSYDRSAGEKYYSSTCTRGTGSSPLCHFDPASPQFGCCCPGDGCWTPPTFNWIIGTCKGSGCGNYYNTPATRKYKDAGSELLVNYVASYQWNAGSRMWDMVADSSFNTNGSLPAYDSAKPNGGLSPSQAWLQPQPGGSAAWTWGYYPAGVKGVGAPGMLFVLSVEKAWNLAWYMLNQVTLDKGPDKRYPNDRCKYGNDNCWASGNAGEIDFLEAMWTVNAGVADDYRRLYATQWNQVGRSFVGDMGSTCHADGGWFTENLASTSYFLGTKSNQTEPYVFAAIVDQIGTFIYRIPASQSEEIWPGLSRKTAACTLNARPTQRPQNKGPPCDDSTPYCALFLPNCQSDVFGGMSAGHQGGANQGCKVNAEQGWCQNWWRQFSNTGQWLWPENGRRSVVQWQAPAAPVAMPWNYEMESWMVDMSGNPQYDNGCCVMNRGHCPRLMSHVYHI